MYCSSLCRLDRDITAAAPYLVRFFTVPAYEGAMISREELSQEPLQARSADAIACAAKTIVALCGAV